MLKFFIMKKTDICCPKCSNTNIKKNGKDKCGTQRYFCHDCKKTFILECDKKRHWYTSKEKAFISMLLNLIEPVNEENLDIHKIVNNIDESKLYVNMTSFEHKVVNEKELQCFQPKILICKDDTDIKIYHFDVRQPMRNPRREILLIDDNKNSKRYGD